MININSIKAVILAGGSGTRLWPLSRLQLPKQFLRLQGERTLLESTVEHLSPLILPSDVLVVTGVEHAEGEAYNSLRPYQTLLEPVGRNTAPAIALAAAWLQNHGDGEDPIMVVLPADHIIKQTEALQDALRKSVDLAKEGKLITFGIKPTRPDTGYGYIKVRDQFATNGAMETLPVEQFTEKPSQTRAEQFMSEGNYYWNSGIFVWQTSTILAEIEAHLPDVYSVLNEIRTTWRESDKLQDSINRHFSTMPNISIDYGVLEKSTNVSLIPCELGWSDVGSWDTVHEIAEHDDAGNAVQGYTIVKDCRNSLIHSNNRLVAAVGVQDVCIVETADAVLITKRGESQRVREIVDELKKANAQERVLHLTVQRPWGQYTVLEELPGFKMKRITVNPGGCLSLQCHQHRSEHWVVISGTASVTQEGEIITVTKNQSTYIPIGVKHRLENRGKIPLEMIEVQVGEYLGEDDIERFEDNYERR
ncbi:mannose-1-phosphate guanylyltransferase/mannose-6-phosphate isomerase [Candidatus Vondammii sp. HM_W22]|uniref:mannose-1-phosphate guanylyltransferase/mannose-6-phosphate isomerase n=1 Tax=Candidatus Vondammii sp. HM_W22 TaxID=2687299 RepID=UPI001F131062|nr:mannose-1-phosphate guanylyltransferase/mannose-6-phosphate isomerase [Candidatus Vondammii sp. HM_W22]